MKKEKYLQIFNYLLEFSKLRSKPVRDISNSSNYPEIIWMSEIPEHDRIDCITHQTFSKESDHWLKVSKPLEPIEPGIPNISEEISIWIKPESWYQEDGILNFYDSIIGDEGEEILLEDHPLVKEKLDVYRETNWVNDFTEYWAIRKPYESELKDYEKANAFYKRLFSISNKSQQFGEEYEFICGLGLVNFKENEDTPLLCRHIVTSKAEIHFEYSKKDSSIIVRPNIQNELLIETDAIIDLFDQFDSADIIDGEKRAKELIKEKELVNPFDSDIHDVLQLLAERMHPGDGKYIESLDVDQNAPKKMTVFFAPALILRKRDTRSFTSTYEKIIDDIETNEEPSIPILDDIIVLDGNPKDETRTNEDGVQNVAEQVYFPKKYNDDQISIISKAKYNNKVLVQGPPGTGKSHTIANLLCHLLANGKKVLVTAYTKRALEVLKDQLPKQFQNLTVNLLSGDSASIKELEASVNTINDELSNLDIKNRKDKIKKLETKLEKLRADRAMDTNELLKIKEKSSRTIEINPSYKGTLTEIAESIESNSLKYEWYKDEFYDWNNSDSINQVRQYIKMSQHYSEVDCKVYDQSLPQYSKLLKLRDVEQLFDTHESEDGDHDISPKNPEVTCSDFPTLQLLLEELLEEFAAVLRIQHPQQDVILDDLRNHHVRTWQSRVDKSGKILLDLDKYDLRKLDRNIEIQYPKGKTLINLKSDAKSLLTFLKSGNSLSGVNFKIKKAFLPKEIKEKLYFTESVIINGSACDTIEEFNAVLVDIRIKQNFEELSQIWAKNDELSSTNSERFESFQRLHNDTIEILGHLIKITDLQNQIIEISDIKINKVELSLIKQIIRDVSRAESKNKAIDNNTRKQQVLKYLDSQNFHPISIGITKAISENNAELYKTLTTELNELQVEFDQYNEFLALGKTLGDLFPDLTSKLSSNNFHKTVLEDLSEAIQYKHACIEVQKLLNGDYKNDLVQRINEYDRTEEKVVAQLAAEKSWTCVLEELKSDRSLRQHLEAWVQAVRKIGKTGKGKRALKYRKVAQEEMEYCKTSVPCWIMPLYKVTETIQPEKGIYDYVIVDEASQLGPDALFLLYLTKNIIIVGDDKQTSPEYIGVDANTMSPFINKHLEGIPFKNFYGTEHSFFDHAKRFCDGTIVLREHFRCMPEIIEYSNKHFYAPDGKGLDPLRQYSENRLEPLKAVYCQAGYIEGRGSTIQNKPEAEAITQKIAEIICDNKYSGKSIGVICLQGKSQSSLIESLLVRKIGEKAYRERRIICGTSASFQGDERDIMFLSLVTATNHNRSALTRPEDERRFNVAASRAKDQMWLFHSVMLDDLTNTKDLRYSLIDHFLNHKPKSIPKALPIERIIGNQPEPFDSWFEVDVYNDIVEQGYSVQPQYEVARGKYRIDLVAFMPDGTKIAIECDGDKWHGAEQYQNDLLRQKVLERCGWQFFRIRGGEYYSNREESLKPLWNIFDDHGESTKQQVEFQLNEDTKFGHSHETKSEIKAEETAPKSQESNFDAHEDKILRFLNLDSNGTYIMTEGQPMKSDFVLPIKESETNGYLLQCYSSGHVNKVIVKSLLSKKIGKQYMNGLNSKDKLIHFEIIREEGILCIIYHDDQEKKFKAHMTENISSRELMHLQGYKVMYNDFQHLEYRTLPISVLGDIKRLVFQSFSAVGKAFNNTYYDKEWRVLNRFNLGIGSKILDNVQASIVDSSLENESPEQSVYRIQYLSSNKIVTIRIVEKAIKGIEIVDGVQLVNSNSPLARSLAGHSPGDEVRIEETPNTIKILEILE